MIYTYKTEQWLLNIFTQRNEKLVKHDINESARISAVFKYILNLIYQIYIVFNFCMKFKNIYIKKLNI